MFAILLYSVGSATFERAFLLLEAGDQPDTTLVTVAICGDSDDLGHCGSSQTFWPLLYAKLDALALCQALKTL